MRNITEYHLSQRQYSDPDGYLSSLREEEWREETLLPELWFSPPLFYLFVRRFLSLQRKACFRNRLYEWDVPLYM